MKESYSPMKNKTNSVGKTDPGGNPQSSLAQEKYNLFEGGNSVGFPHFWKFYLTKTSHACPCNPSNMPSWGHRQRKEPGSLEKGVRKGGGRVRQMRGCKPHTTHRNWLALGLLCLHWALKRVWTAVLALWSSHVHHFPKQRILLACCCITNGVSFRLYHNLSLHPPENGICQERIKAIYNQHLPFLPI